MDRLPKETFLSIISDIGLRDKLQCILVCRNWHLIITSTLLYEELSFTGTSQKFYNAFELLHGNQHLSQQVKRLNITNCDIGIVTDLSLPTLFPNVRHLTWKTRIYKTIKIPHELLRQTLLKDKWQQLRSFDTWFSNGFPFGYDLLKLSSFNHLTTLSVKFLEKTQFVDLASTLARNTKSLINLALDNVIITTTDLEKLHGGVPHLESLNFINVMLSGNSTTLVNTTIAAAERLSILRLSLSSQLNTTCEQRQEVTIYWLRYISHKYTNVQTLALKPGNDDEQIARNYPVEQEVVKMVSRMENLEEYAVRVCPITAEIATTITTPCDVFIWINSREDNFWSQIESISTSSNPYILSVYINGSRWDSNICIPSPPFNQRLKLLPNLTVFSLRNIAINHRILMFAIVHLPNLVFLHIDQLRCSSKHENPYGAYFTIPEKRKLRTLILGIEMRRSESMRPFNRIFSKILPICKRLKSVSLSGHINSNSNPLVLDFSGNKHLKYIDIDIDGTHCYEFAKVGYQDSLWEDYNIPVHFSRYNCELTSKFRVELVWPKSSSLSSVYLKRMSNEINEDRKYHDKSITLAKMKMEDLWIHEINAEVGYDVDL